MNSSTLLIDAIVRQTVVLIAAMATGAGQRPSISHIADQVFTDLVKELKDLGLGSKVIADMFGMALRTYHKRVAQLSESQTAHGQSLWSAVYEHVQQTGPVLRGEILVRFARDSEQTVRAVLKDLVDNDLVYRSGRGDRTTYRARTDEESLASTQSAAQRERLLLVALHHRGAVAATEIASLLPAAQSSEVADALANLVREGLVVRIGADASAVYECQQCVIPFGDQAGWEAAVFDHFQAMVVALSSKFRFNERTAGLGDRVGGSTFVFDIWRGHPFEDEVLDFLRETRTRGLTLRRRLDVYGEQHAPSPDATRLRVVAYVGQSATEGHDPSTANHGAESCDER
jgi:predicted transcriptional regulator